MTSGKCINTLQGHSQGVCRLHQLDSGKFLSSSQDKTIKIWNVEEGTCKRTLDSHTSSLGMVRVNSQSNRLVSRSNYGKIITWNLRTGACINSFCCTKCLWESTWITFYLDFLYRAIFSVLASCNNVLFCEMFYFYLSCFLFCFYFRKVCS